MNMIEPRKARKFEINKQHVECAVRGDACNCVIARAFQDACGSKLLEVRVRATNTELTFEGGREERYATGEVLRNALTKFDKTGNWDLPEGTYELQPVPKSQTKAAVRARAARRTAEGDPHKKRKYASTGRCTARKLNPRAINLKRLRDGVANLQLAAV